MNSFDMSTLEQFMRIIAEEVNVHEVVFYYPTFTATYTSGLGFPGYQEGLVVEEVR